jgi:hypothetical protein
MRKITRTTKRRRHLGWNTHAGKTLTIVLILLNISLIYLILLHGSQHKKIPPRLPEREYFGSRSWRVSRKIKAVITKNWYCFFAIIFFFARNCNYENNVVGSLRMASWHGMWWRLRSRRALSLDRPLIACLLIPIRLTQRKKKSWKIWAVQCWFELGFVMF